MDDHEINERIRRVRSDLFTEEERLSA